MKKNVSLIDYQKKRDFNKTSEPKVQKKYNKKSLIYIIQKHDASHLHYDLRLAWNGVLKSWAVPKGPSFNPAEKRLAIEVEDHPLSYASFEGVIPASEYGGGIVMLWDQGTWEPLEDPTEGLNKGKLTFLLHGEKLQGEWTLLRMAKNDNKNNWLLIKKEDEYANKVTDKKLLETVSVKTGMSLKDIAFNKKKIDDSNVETSSIKTLSGARKQKMPTSFSPELAVLVKDIPESTNWQFEIKLDGYRILAFINKGTIKLMTRNGHDWTHRFIKIHDELKKISMTSAILDGEMVVLDKNGVSQFQLLQNDLSNDEDNNIIYFIFDFPYCNGYDLKSVPLINRRILLKKTLENSKFDENIRFSDHLHGDAKSLMRLACKLKLEGLIAKNENSHYQNKRSGDWLKIKCSQMQEFVIGGYTSPAGTRKFFGSLLIGYFDKNKHLCYAGRVGTGFNQKNLQDIYSQMQKIKQKETPFYHLPKIPEVKNAYWIQPNLLAEIEFSEWTNDKRLRHPSFRGLREDKKANEVHIELPIKKKQIKHMLHNSDSMAIDNIILTHPDKIFFPEVHITKADLAEYYHQYMDIILPYVINRPLAILRCPEGVDKICFYQKHLETLPASIGAVKIHEKKVVSEHMVIKNAASIIALVQYGALEFHSWGCTADNIDKPDRMIFDLDPAHDVSFNSIIECAQMLHAGLAGLGLQSFVKTSGKKGIHVYVPLKMENTWKEVKSFSYALAQHMVKLAPDKFTSNMALEKRKGKIFIDYLRNQRGSTCVAPFSLRATANANISVPLAWEELEKLIASNQYDLSNINKRMAHLKNNPWKDFFKIKQKIPDYLF